MNQRQVKQTTGAYINYNTHETTAAPLPVQGTAKGETLYNFSPDLEVDETIELYDVTLLEQLPDR